MRKYILIVKSNLLDIHKFYLNELQLIIQKRLRKRSFLEKLRIYTAITACITFVIFSSVSLAFIRQSLKYVNNTPQVKYSAPSELNNFRAIKKNRPMVLSHTIISNEAREGILESYLKSKGSPLADYANDLITVSDEYALDWRLVASISGQESHFCEKTPLNSNNCWGWGWHETSKTTFPDYSIGIRKVAKSLRTDYLNRGLLTPCQIMTRYTPFSPNGAWCKGVTYFMDEIDSYKGYLEEFPE